MMKFTTDLNLEKTLFCGQFFRVKTREEAYEIYFKDQRILARQGKGFIEVQGTCPKEELEKFFDLNRDYGKIRSSLEKDPLLKKPLEEARGIHILGQDPWEVLISFILSQNSNISRIRTNLFALCQEYGPRKEDAYGTYYGFPSPQDLAQVTREDYREKIRVGYRDKYLEEATSQVLREAPSLEAIGKLKDSQDRLRELTRFFGVGEKVAHCILLFGYQDFFAFPIDVWMKRILMDHYGLEAKKDYYSLGQKLFSPYPGYAQQALFYYSKNHKLGG